MLWKADRRTFCCNWPIAPDKPGIRTWPIWPTGCFCWATGHRRGYRSSHADWDGLYHRRLILKTGQALLEAPSITELSLLRPQFAHVLTVLEERKEWSPILESLLPVLTNMRDSERGDAVDDRLVYLNQAAVRLRQVQEQLSEHPSSIERTLVRAITRRWTGLLTAEIEDHRGRAELEVTLKP